VSTPRGISDTWGSPFPHRFWDEQVRLQGLFERHREADDNANAAACFGRLQHFRYRELASRPAFDSTRKSIISVFQPKSGGTYLHNRMLALGYQDFWWLYAHRSNASYCYASDEALRLYLAGGCTCHTHARPDPNILAALDRAGVDKIWVHLRNPAESVVSCYHHYLGEGHGSGEIGEQRKQKALDEAQREGLAPGTEKSSYVTEIIGWYLEWIVQWLKFARDRPGLVVFSDYSELANPHALLSRVFKELRDELKGNVSAEPTTNDRIRKKEGNNWRHDLSPAAQNYLEQRVRAELQEFPAFDRMWR